MEQEAGSRVPGYALVAAAVIGPPAVVAWFKEVGTWPGFIWACLAASTALTLVFGLFMTVIDDLKGRWATRLADVLDEVMLRMFSSYRRKVSKYIRAAYSHLDSKGLSTVGDHTLSLKEVFVSLVLDPAATNMLQSDPIRYGHGKGARVPQDIWHWLGQVGEAKTALAIIGPPGSGKTTLLHHVVYVLMNQRRLSIKVKHKRSVVPILVPLRDHKDGFDVGNPALPEVIRHSLAEVQGSEPPRWVERQLERGKILLLLDGLDEVASDVIRRKISTWVDKQRRQYPQIQFVVTSRPFGYRSNPLGTATVLQVNRFTPMQIEQFVSAWYSAIMLRSYGRKRDTARLKALQESANLLTKLKNNPALDDLAANPLLLTMIASVHHYQGALPGTRSDLYREVCEVLLGKRHQAREIELDMQGSKKQAVLQVLAFALMEKRVRDVSISDAKEYIESTLQRVAPAVDVADFLVGVENSSGLLIEHEAGVYSFAHLTFQEYLAAVHMRECGDSVIDQIDVADSWWHETLRLYAAQVDASILMARCLDKAEGDAQILALAVDCLKEAREISPDLRLRLEQLVSPVNMEFDIEQRRLAATVRLLLRRRGFVRLGEDSRLSPEPVTSLEYQAFLDAARSNRQFRPEHWRPDRFEATLADKPALGVSLEGAFGFTRWFQENIELEGRTCRLPLRREVDSISGRGLIDSAHNQVVVTLTVDEAGLSSESKIGVSDPRECAEAVLGQLRADRILVDSMDAEVGKLLPQILVGRIKKNGNAQGSEDLEAARLKVIGGFDSWLDNLIESGWAAFAEQIDSVGRIDAFSICADVNAVTVDLMRIGRMRTTRLHYDVVGYMAAWSGIFSGAADIGFHKGGVVDDETDRARLRGVARVACLMLAEWCERHAQKAQRVDLVDYRKRFIGLYVRFAIMEAQIDGRIAPNQGFHLALS